jgi:hypothetical protein
VLITLTIGGIDYNTAPTAKARAEDGRGGYNKRVEDSEHGRGEYN